MKIKNVITAYHSHFSFSLFQAYSHSIYRDLYRNFFLLDVLLFVFILNYEMRKEKNIIFFRLSFFTYWNELTRILLMACTISVRLFGRGTSWNPINWKIRKKNQFRWLLFLVNKKFRRNCNKILTTTTRMWISREMFEGYECIDALFKRTSREFVFKIVNEIAFYCEKYFA